VCVCVYNPFKYNPNNHSLEQSHQCVYNTKSGQIYTFPPKTTHISGCINV